MGSRREGEASDRGRVGVGWARAAGSGVGPGDGRDERGRESDRGDGRVGPDDGRGERGRGGGDAEAPGVGPRPPSPRHAPALLTPIRVSYPSLSRSPFRVSIRVFSRIAAVVIQDLQLPCPTRLSESPIRVACWSRLSESPIRVACPSRPCRVCRRPPAADPSIALRRPVPRLVAAAPARQRMRTPLVSARGGAGRS